MQTRGVLKSRKKVLSNYLDLGGTLRHCDVQETLAWMRHHQTALGITRISDVTHLDCIGIPVALCVRPNAKHLSISMGKGLSFEMAYVSALGEAIEMFHLENPPDIAYSASYHALTHLALPVISPREFNRGFIFLQSIEDISLDWVWAVELFSKKEVLIPHILTHLNSTRNHPEYAYFQVSTNGIATGNTKTEAMCHALYEIIERDSLAQLSMMDEYERRARLLSLSSITGLNAELLQKFQRAHITVKLWDITSMLGIPAFQCAIFDENPYRVQGVFRGSGCHLSKDIALSRALMEAAQSRLGVIAGSRDDLFPDQYQQSMHRLSEQEGVCDFSRVINIDLMSSFTDHLHYLLNQLAHAGYHKVYLVEHTKNTLQLPVVQLFVPGMHFNGMRT